MPRPLRYEARRVVALTKVADGLLIKIAGKKQTVPAELARNYVEDGITRDAKKLGVK
jgi:hypothetical protein